MVGRTVTFAVLRPDTDTESLPVMLWLHGGGGSHAFLDQCRPLFEQLWAEDALPPMVVATPDAGRSFYLDRADGSERWEQFVLDELLPEVRRITTSATGASATAIGGVSMGGMGSLRMAFRRPDTFAAVAAIEPGIEPTEHWDEVLVRDRLYRDDALVHSLYGDPVDVDHFRENHPLRLVDRNGPAIVASGLAISIDCGDADVLHLAHGAEAMHRRLFDQAIAHAFHLVRGGDHLGPTLAPRISDALRFVGRALRPAEPVVDPMLEALRELVAANEMTMGYRTNRVIDGPAGAIEVSTVGQGPTVVLLASLGRTADDFADLANRLAEAGYQAIAPQPRGIGRTEGLHAGLTMGELAADVAAVIRASTDAPAYVVGHAFGNRVARMTATEHPGLVAGVACLAAGGLVPPSARAAAALVAVFDRTRAPDAHADAVAEAFFAPGNDPTPFLDGWHVELAAAQRHATESTPVEHWWSAGTAPVLVVQGADDVIALRENAERLAATGGQRVEILDVPRAGHALLPEQPGAVATALLGWLSRRPLPQ